MKLIIKKNIFFQILMVLTIGTFPIYIFDSGSLQISHMFILLLLVVLIFKKNIKIIHGERKFVILLFLFTIFTLLVDTIYTFYDGNYSNLKLSSISIFNLFIYIVISSYLKKFDKKIIYYGLITSIILIVNYFLFFFDTSFYSPERAKGLFNNPNQLGYFAICSYSLLFFFYKALNLNLLFFLIFALVCFFFSLLSLSKASILSYFIILLLNLIILFKFKIKKIFLLLFLLIISIIFINISQKLELNFYIRILNMGNENDGLYGRGYYLLSKISLYDIFKGIGKENLLILNDQKEIHSTLLNILFRYGLFGLSLFLIILYLWAIRVFKFFGIVGIVNIILPVMIYGLSHNGFRFSLLWILISTTYCFSIFNSRINKLSHT